MSKSGFFNKKFIIIAISIILVIAIVVGCVFLFSPKVDLDAPYNDTYSVTQSDDYSYMFNKNQYVCTVLGELNGVENENFDSVVQAFFDINTTLQLLSYQNEFLLKNLLFTQDKDSKMLKLQQDISNKRKDIEEIMQNSKVYIEQYLTSEAIATYPDDNATFTRIQNYFNEFYKDFAKNLTSYYKMIADVFDRYLVDTFEVNNLTKRDVLSLYYWADKLCEYYSSGEVDQNALSLSVQKLGNFSNSLSITNSQKYTDDMSKYDAILANFNKLNFDEVIDNLAKNTYDEYIASLGEEQSACATALKSYFMV